MRATRAIISAILLLGSAAGALAEEPSGAPLDEVPFTIGIPKGWQRLDGQSKVIASHVARTTYFGQQKLQSGADAFTQRGSDIALVVTWVIGREPLLTPDLSVAREIARAGATWKNATLRDGVTERVAWKTAVEDNVASARLEYRHRENETLTIARTLIYLGADKTPRLITAECMYVEKLAPQLRPVCDKVLSSIKVTEDERAPLTQLPPVKAPTETGEESGEDSSAAAGDVSPAPGIHESGEGTPGVLVTREKKDSSKSYRWLWVAGGLLLLVAFWITTRSRKADIDERVSRETRGEEDDSPPGAEAEDAILSAEPEPEPEPKPEPEPDRVAEIVPGEADDSPRSGTISAAATSTVAAQSAVGEADSSAERSATGGDNRSPDAKPEPKPEPEPEPEPKPEPEPEPEPDNDEDDQRKDSND